jgi:thiol-disulfide isomerase/thioredoxin
MIPRPLLAWLCVVMTLASRVGAESAAPDEGRRHALGVTVRDAETGQPLSGVEVVSMESRDVLKATTDAGGRATLSVALDSPQAERQLRFDVTVRAPGYAVRRVMWNAGSGRVRESLPREHEVRLTRGMTIGGVVRDSQGKAVEGARIELHGSGYKGFRLGGDTKSSQEFTEISAYGSMAPVSDENGAWRIDNFPPELDGVALTVIRPGGARAHFKTGGSSYLQGAPGSLVDLAALKSGQAELNLNAGFTIAGRVVDEAGGPLSGVILRARDASSRSQAHEFTTDFEGRFELRHWDAARVLVSAERDGYQGATVTVSTGADAAEAKIMLRPGQPLRLQVLDGEGKPVPGAEIMTDPNPSEQIVSWKTETDAEGRAVWLAAPGQPVKYWINAKQHGFRSVKLPADGTEHVIRFRPGADRSVNLRLRVVDAATGRPVDAFEVWRRMPGGNSSFKPWGEAGAPGDFLRELAVDDFPKGFVQGYRLQVRAPGYGSWGSETLDFANGDQDFTVRLVKGGAELPDAPEPTRQVGNGQDGDSDPTLLVLGTQVARLLETGDVTAFSDAVCATEADWQAVVPAGVSSPLGNRAPVLLDRRKKAVVASAERVLALARRAGLEPGSLRFDVKSIGFRTNSRTHYRSGGQDTSVATARTIRLILLGEPAGEKAGRDHQRGEYQLSIGQTHQLPAGWKCEQGVRWVALPAGVGDDVLKGELRLANRVADEALGSTRSLSGADDDALGIFGEAVAGLLRTREVAGFVAAVGPSRLGLSADDTAKYEEEMAAAVRNLLALPEREGIDFARANVTVKQVIAGAVNSSQFGSTESLRANSLQVILAVDEGETGAGRSIAGRYTVSFGDALRKDGQWILGSRKIRWEQIPEALLTGDTKQVLALENHVAEHRALPPGIPAPDIELEGLAGDVRTLLSSYRGKVVILEFWAVWCGPCQEPMAKLQELVQAHPEWKDRVEVITVSIDAKAADAAAHLKAKGWQNTTNFWAGEGAWNASAAKAYRVSSIPTSCVIGPDGQIVASGNPASIDFAAVVGSLLK